MHRAREEGGRGGGVRKRREGRECRWFARKKDSGQVCEEVENVARETHLTDVAPHYYFADTDDSILVALLLLCSPVVAAAAAAHRCLLLLIADG